MLVLVVVVLVLLVVMEVLEIQRRQVVLEETEHLSLLMHQHYSLLCQPLGKMQSDPPDSMVVAEVAADKIIQVSIRLLEEPVVEEMETLDLVMDLAV
jgi:hypothetical protein